MKRIISICLIFVIALGTLSISFAKNLGSISVGQLKEKNNNERIVLENFIYNINNNTPYKINLSKKDEKDVRKDITFDKNVVWSTSDDSVAKVTENGEIYSINAGIAEITITYGDFSQEYTFEVIDDKPIDYEISSNNVVLKNKGMTKYIIVKAIMPDNSKIEVNNAVKWISQDPSVATVGQNGWVSGESKGKTKIKASINGVDKYIDVEVLSSNYNEEIQDFIKTMNDKEKEISISLSSDERDTILDKCSEMYNVTWTPTSDLPKWGSGVFEADESVTGLPYSQWSQCDAYGTLTSGLSGYYSKGFIYALENNSNFYSPVYNDSDDYPMYGNDCSGFVSLALGIDRHNTWTLTDGIKDGEFDKVGSYNSDSWDYTPPESELLESYPSMQYGDAVVSYYGEHTFMVGNNYSTGMVAYEQTPPKLRIKWFDYSDLAEAYYLPFSKK